jgi:hypothetical protein
MLNAARHSDPPQLKTYPSGSLFGFSTYKEAARIYEESERERLRNA